MFKYLNSYRKLQYKTEKLVETSSYVLRRELAGHLSHLCENPRLASVMRAFELNFRWWRVVNVHSYTPIGRISSQLGQTNQLWLTFRSPTPGNGTRPIMTDLRGGEPL